MTLWQSMMLFLLGWLACEGLVVILLVIDQLTGNRVNL